MSRCTRSVSLPKEMDDLVEEKFGPREFSSYVQDCIRRDFPDDFIEIQIKKKKEEIEELTKSLGKTKIIKKKLNEEEQIFINRTRENIKRNGEMTGSVNNIVDACRLYNQKFSKKISPSEFKKVLEL
jgi:hypothetical protein